MFIQGTEETSRASLAGVPLDDFKAVAWQRNCSKSSLSLLVSPALSHRHSNLLGCRLSRLSLANNSITSLEPRSFEHLPCLQILDISRSKLSTLARDSFYGLEQLEVLSLHGNELHNISGDHLSHLPSLEKLLLGSKPGWDNATLTAYELEAGNLIKFLPPRLFEGNPALELFRRQWQQHHQS